MESDSDTECLIENLDWDLSSESDSDEGSSESSSNWIRMCNETLEPAPPRFSFTAIPGLKVSVEPPSDPLAYFNLFFNDEIIQNIVSETNRYASQYFEQTELAPFSRSRSWEDTNCQELKLFLALLMLQGVIQKPAEKWMWSRRPVLETPIFGKIMSQKRYSLIMKFLHVEKDELFDKTNNSKQKACKIFTLHEKLVQRFQSVYIPERDVTIGDSLIAYNGLLGWKQCNPNKHAWFGVRLFQLCESKSGYIWNSIVYAGKGTTFNEEYSSYCLATKSVLSLMHKLLRMGYFVTTDDSYTSPELAEVLIENKTDICGAVRCHRKGLPPNMREPMGKGEVFAFQKGKICVLKWNDKKIVRMLSTVHNNETREVKNKTRVLQKPLVVIDYMQKVNDKADQCLSYYSVVQNQQRKYYKKIFQHLLHQATWNAFILYKKNGENSTHVEFKLRLIERILEENAKAMQMDYDQGKSSHAYPNVTRLMGRHFPVYIHSGGKPRSRKCVVCAKLRTETGKRMRRETRFQCEQCCVGLCVVPCFKIYHTEAEL